MPTRRPFPARVRASRSWLWLIAATALCGAQTGCINVFAMASKMVLGEPKQLSAFEMATGVSLKKSKKQILIHASALSLVAEAHGSLTSDVQEALIRKMRRRGLLVLPPDSASEVLDRYGGKFDPKLLAREIDDVDYIMEIEFTNFSYKEEASPNLYRGQSSGRIYGYEVRGDTGSRHVVKIFDQQFKTTYPTTHPVPVDQTPKNVFIRRFIDHISDSLGASFYDVQTSDLFSL